MPTITLRLGRHNPAKSVVWFDRAGQLLRLDGDVVRIENAVRFEHGDDVKSFFI
ncbi:UNVERIFIED_ORG: hypothetical protein BDK47_13530 [Anoxybacillus amylolyticus]|uniref:Uncharacterized protein n=3 Tax=Geobacillus TaxID=129337 RepID=Q5L307_GEOKA|nr:hypothetical protein GA8_06510 [Geobacillus sp. A8]ESU72852.1 hypothetical protein T260_06315 [Geobacillus sp. MAS1]MEB3752039.1 hypothetical protein [Geobacillus icigianus]BAD74673.1 hypothetical protein GK0388 [Geobacillus kaustophilus HTA426]